MMKLVISTKVEIGFCPMAFKRFCSHSGDGPFFTPLTERAKKAGQPSWSSVRTSGPGPSPLIAGTFSDFSAPRPEAAKSRAMPRTPMQSCRLGVIATSMTGRSEEHTSELQSLMRISYAVFCLKKKKYNYYNNYITRVDNTEHHICTETPTSEEM